MSWCLHKPRHARQPAAGSVRVRGRGWTLLRPSVHSRGIVGGALPAPTAPPPCRPGVVLGGGPPPAPCSAPVFRRSREATHCGGRAAGESAGPRRQRAQGRMQHHTGRCPLVEVEDVRRAQRGDTEKGHGCGGACSQRLRIRAYHIVCWRRKISNRLHTHEISQPKFPEFSSYRPGRGGERRSREPSRLDATGTPSVSYNTAKIVIIARTRLRVLRKKVRTQHTHTHAHMRAPGHDHDGER